ncbi:MAG: hypothetical protein IJX44_00805 [Bacteroidaceae bacterium]|nr:hypothetical protein [Bacteroidaceae bacterium]
MVTVTQWGTPKDTDYLTPHHKRQQKKKQTSPLPYHKQQTGEQPELSLCL